MTLTESSSVVINDTQESWIISTPLEIALETHFHVHYDTETTPVFLLADREASYLLLPSLASLLSGGKLKPENTYSCILYPRGDRPGLRKHKKRISIKTNHNYHQRSPPYASFIINQPNRKKMRQRGGVQGAGWCKKNIYLIRWFIVTPSQFPQNSILISSNVRNLQHFSQLA